ncbi:MAG: hypothetical protein K6F58_00740 [Bacteroidales bacterium]|nr:hypothetical protein [Bacteroidales bacterium]
MADYVRTRSIELTEKDERAIRDCLNDYSNSSEGHPFANYGDKVKIKTYDKTPIFIARFASEFDSRQTEERKRPYNNEQVEPRTVYRPSDVDLWKLHLLTTSGFTRQDQSFIAPGSAHVETCPSCGGKGKWTCRTCGGSREITCSRCGGDKVETCPSCGGSRTKTCPSCNGKGKWQESHQEQYIVSQTYREGSVVPDTQWGSRTVYTTKSCSSCNGNGKTTCSNCRGSGTVTCSKCGGRGKVTCPTCNGSGIETCGDCAGRGRHLHYIGVDQKLYPEYRYAQFHDKRLLKIEELVDSNAKHQVTQLFERQDGHLSAGVFSEDTEIGRQIDSWISEHSGKENYNLHILFQNVKVQKVDAWYLEYELNGKKYYGAIADGRFYAGFSPITEYAVALMKKADKRIGGLGTVSARKMLEQAEKMKVYGQGTDISRLKAYVEKHLNTLYNTGIDLIFWLMALFVTPFLMNFYRAVNPVMGYAYFTNQELWKPGSMLPLMQCIIFLAALLFLRSVLREQDHSKHRFKSVFGFMLAGMGVYLAGGLAILLVLLALNYLGLSAITTFVGWCAWRVIRLVLIIVIVIIALMVKLFKWIWGLIF